MAWEDVLRQKISELELIASWASSVQYGRVRDFCRSAEWELKQHVARLEEHKAKSPQPQGA